MPTYVVNDPLGEITYQTDDDALFLSDLLNQVTHNADTGAEEVWQLGTQTALLDEPVLIATHETIGDLLYSVATADFIYSLYNVEVGDGIFNYAWWIVAADGSQSLLDVGLSDDYPFSASYSLDQDREHEAHNMLEVDDGVAMQILPAGTSLPFTYTGLTGASNIEASTWAGIIDGDNSTDATPIDPPDPFDVAQTSNGFFNNGVMQFSRDHDSEPFSAWDGATFVWDAPGDYSGPTAMQLVEGITILLAGVEQLDETDIGIEPGAETDAIRAAYNLADNEDGSPQSGALIGDYNPELFPDPGAPDEFARITMTIHGTLHVVPEAPVVYRAGEYTYVDADLNEVSTYGAEEVGLPGTQEMRSDYLAVVAGRYTGIVAPLQAADNYGGGTQLSVVVHFAPFTAISGELGEQRTRFF